MTSLQETKTPRRTGVFFYAFFSSEAIAGYGAQT